ncbi:hypothetical protein Peur_004847 [Populus x canadensis]
MKRAEEENSQIIPFWQKVREGEPNKAALALLKAIETSHVLSRRDVGPRPHTGYVARLDRQDRLDKASLVLLLPT